MPAHFICLAGVLCWIMRMRDYPDLKLFRWRKSTIKIKELF